MHPDLIAALAEDRCKSCSCGAVNGEPGGLCCKCLTRMVWRRCIGQPARHAVRRHSGRQARSLASIFAVAMPILRTIGKGGRS